jgi:hypothetical protein
VPELFTEAWAAALEAAAAADPAVGAALAGHPLVLAEQIVDAGPHPTANHPTRDADADARAPAPRWHHVRIAADGTVQVRLGRPDDADITFTLDDATARAVHSGELDAGRAFVEGRLRVAGDLAALPRHATALAVLAGPWEAVRRTTTCPTP